MTARPARQRKNAQKIAVAMACLALATFIGFRGSKRGLRSPPPETVAFTGDPLGAPAVEYSSPVMADVPERTEPSALTPLRSTGASPPAPEDSESGQEKGTRRVQPPSDEFAALGYGAAAAAQDTKYGFIIEPRISFIRIQAFDPRQGVKLIADAGGHRATGGGFLANRPTVRLTDSPLRRAPDVVLTVDHPGAMPTSVSIQSSSWGFDGQTFTVSPSVTLIPMDGRLRLAKALPPSLRGAPGAYPFEGQCALVTIGVDGDIRVLDSYHISELERRRPPALRFTVEHEAVMVLGIPDSPAGTGDVIHVASIVHGELDPTRVARVPTTLRGIKPPRHDFMVLGPFQEPMEGCQIIATVDPAIVGIIDENGAPVQFHGFVLAFAGPSTKLSTVTAQNVTGDEVSLIPVGLVRAGATAESTASGEAILEGIPLGTHLASVASPFGDVETLDTLLTDANELMIVGAPAVGVIVQCPLEWRKDKAGRDAWARARIELTGEYRGLPFTARDGQALLPRRYIVRPGLPLTVTCTASGHAPLMAELTGQPSRTVSTVYPAASVSSDKR